jgi:hypothetical protein
MDISTALSEAAEAAMASVATAPADAPPPAPPAKEAPAAPEPDEAPEEGAEEAPEAEADVEAEAESDESPAMPEGYVAVPVVEDQLATEFTLSDAEGEVEIPALIVEYKANGKVRKDRLDQVVKLAQFGVYNEAREQQFKQTEQQAMALQQEREEYAKLLDEREAQLERLLQDEDFFLSVRDAYQAENSPEKRAERAEREVERVRAEAQLSRIQEVGSQFYEGEVRPALDLIAQTLPSVTPAELEERMAYAMQLHAQVGPNGQPYLPASQFDAARQYIVNDLAVWAQMTHARRSEVATPPQVVEAQQAAVKAQVEAQKAKRALGKATQPVGRAATPDKGKPKATKPKTLDDALDSAMDEIMASIR